MNNVIFELKEISFSYLSRFPALCSVNMGIKQGEKISIIGANGCGKSTLLQVLDGLIFPDKGEARFLGTQLNEGLFVDEDFSKNFRKKVGFVFQNPDVQLFCPTVKDDIYFGPLQLGEKKEGFRKRFDMLVDFLGIGSLLDRAPYQLSVGEKRKVAIASTLIIDPEILILDEPTAGLDPLTTRHIIDLLLEANNSGKTVITSTHDLHIIEEISDTVYVFNSGKTIIRSGPPVEILNDEGLLKNNNLVHIHRHRHEDKVHAHPHQHLDHHH